MKYKDLIKSVGDKVGDKIEYIKRLQLQLKESNSTADKEKIQEKINALIEQVYGN
jgi:flagellin-like hook-associated protein FlgL